MEGETAILTIGYGARSIDEFVAALEEAGAEYLVDVRSAPYSRFKPEFSRDPLAARLEARGIRLRLHGRGARRQAGRSRLLRRRRPGRLRATAACARHSRRAPRLEAGWEAGHRIVLMCSEGKPQECHRTKLVAEELVAIGRPGGRTSTSRERSEATARSWIRSPTGRRHCSGRTRPLRGRASSTASRRTEAFTLADVVTIGAYRLERIGVLRRARGRRRLGSSATSAAAVACAARSTRSSTAVRLQQRLAELGIPYVHRTRPRSQQRGAARAGRGRLRGRGSQSGLARVWATPS